MFSSSAHAKQNELYLSVESSFDVHHILFPQSEWLRHSFAQSHALPLSPSSAYSLQKGQLFSASPTVGPLCAMAAMQLGSSTPTSHTGRPGTRFTHFYSAPLVIPLAPLVNNHSLYCIGLHGGASNGLGGAAVAYCMELRLNPHQ